MKLSLLREIVESMDVAIVCPNPWDLRQAQRVDPPWATQFRIVLCGNGDGIDLADFDSDAFIADAVASLRQKGVDGVASSSDYPGSLVAPFISEALGLPGPNPASVLRCAHKYYSRLAQHAVAPDATPKFQLIDPNNLDLSRLCLPFPLFVKPVKSTFSQHARRVDSFGELVRFVRSAGVQSHLSQFVTPFNQLLARYEEFSVDGSYMLAEELLEGKQVTLEGFMSHGRMFVVGIVDSIMYENGFSFKQFDFPSSLSSVVVDRMSDVTARIMASLRYDNGLFNVEFMVDEAVGTVKIIEVNPRMSSQFSDLLEAVNGTSSYEILLVLASGSPLPAIRRRGAFNVASSFVLRRFSDARVKRSPSRHEVEAVEVSYPQASVVLFYRQDERLADNLHEWDGVSYRCAVIDMAGESRESLDRDLANASASLTWDFSIT